MKKTKQQLRSEGLEEWYGQKERLLLAEKMESSEVVPKRIRCKSCLKIKDITRFAKNKPSRYGVLKTCKVCKNISQKGRPKLTKEQMLRRLDVERFGRNRFLALKRDEYKCVVCGMSNAAHIRRWGRSITVDHIDGNGRYSKVKNNRLENLQTLCLSCHGYKDIRRWLNAKRGAA